MSENIKLSVNGSTKSTADRTAEIDKAGLGSEHLVRRPVEGVFR
jgi:hypothetical protein